MTGTFRSLLRKGNHNHPTWPNNKNFFFLLFFVHILHLMTAVLAYWYNLPLLYVFLLIVQTLFSFLYHLKHSRWLLRLADWIFSIMVIIANLYILFTLQNRSEWIMDLIVGAPVVVLAFFLLFSSDYQRHHIYWHLLSILIILIVIT